MYENGYTNNTENTENSQGHGTYTDYVGYGSTSAGSADPSGDNGKKHNRKGKVVAGCIALVLAGLLVGTGVTYAYLNAHNAKQAESTEEAKASDDEKETGKQSADSKTDDKKEIAEVKKADSDDTETAQAASSSTGENLTVEDIAQNNLSSVVAIINTGVTEVRSMMGTYTTPSKSAGSGVIIGETDDELLILTNYHVVSDSEELSVIFSWEEMNTSSDDTDVIEAKIKDYDENRDFAVVAVDMDSLSQDTKNKLSVATIGDSDDLKLGEQIVAIGNALGYGQSVTTGIVSALDRTVQSTSTSETTSQETTANKYIQTDAAINPGNSGGAMFNMKGELVGINSAKIGGSTVEGMGYAIPISDIIDDVENMMNQEIMEEVPEDQRGYLGISIVDVTETISETYGMPQGAYIASINEGGAADKAGLEKEEIITGINGKDVTSGSELKSYLAYYAIGDKVTVTVAHSGEDGYTYRDVEVTLAENDQITSSSEDTQDEQQTEEAPDSDQSQNQGNNGSYFNFSLPFN